MAYLSVSGTIIYFHDFIDTIQGGLNKEIVFGPLHLSQRRYEKKLSHYVKGNH